MRTAKIIKGEKIASQIMLKMLTDSRIPTSCFPPFAICSNLNRISQPSSRNDLKIHTCNIFAGFCFFFFSLRILSSRLRETFRIWYTRDDGAKIFRKHLSAYSRHHSFRIFVDVFAYCKLYPRNVKIKLLSHMFVRLIDCIIKLLCTYTRG